MTVRFHGGPAPVWEMWEEKMREVSGPLEGFLGEGYRVDAGIAPVVTVFWGYALAQSGMM